MKHLENTAALLTEDHVARNMLLPRLILHPVVVIKRRSCL